MIRRKKIQKGQRGTALAVVMLLIATLAVSLYGASLIQQSSIRTMTELRDQQAIDDAAASVVSLLEKRLAARAQERLGQITQSDLDDVSASTSAIPALPPGMTLVPGESGARLVRVRHQHPLPFDETPLALWTDQPRRRYAGVAPVAGRTASRTLEVTVFATVRGTGGQQRTSMRTFGISRVQPYQEALYSNAAAELCAYAGATQRVAGGVTAETNVLLRNCGGTIGYHGPLEVGQNVVDASGGRHTLHMPSGAAVLSTVYASNVELNPDAQTSAWGGYLRMRSGIGAPLPSTRLSSAAVAGSGECLDFDLTSTACGGASAFHPSMFVRGGSSPGYVCGAGYAGCAGAMGAITYTGWPFAASVNLAQAQTDPSDPTRLWKGLLADGRRESRCVATVAGQSWRTHRCATNAWGWTIDAGSLPPIPGGVIAILRSTGYPAAADPDGAREAVVIRNASLLQGPLTIVSQVQVYIVGSFNTASPRPAMIQAPRITVLPAEAEAQLRTTSVWDSVPAAGSAVPRALPLTAETNVTLYGVFRMGSCRLIGSENFGGSWMAAPAVLGDWRRTGLRVVGSVQLEDETAAGAASCRRWTRAMNAPTASGTPVVQPRSRDVLHDPRLLDPGFQPPGSWVSANIPGGGAAGAASRTPARQANAAGGVVAFRALSGMLRGVRAVPAASAWTPPPALTGPPPPLPN